MPPHARPAPSHLRIPLIVPPLRLLQYQGRKRQDGQAHVQVRTNTSVYARHGEVHDAEKENIDLCCFVWCGLSVGSRYEPENAIRGFGIACGLEDELGASTGDEKVLEGF